MNSANLSQLQKDRLKELLSIDEELKLAYSIKEFFESIITKKAFDAHEKFDNWLDSYKL